MAVIFKYSIADCDVADKDALEVFRQSLYRWNFWLEGDERHAIWPQIYNMFWNDAVFRFLNESRRLGYAKESTYVANNGLIGRFVDQGYVATQVMSIRRLIEKKGRRDDRQPISLKRLLSDIAENQRLLTRENYVARDGLPYDWKPVRDRWIASRSDDDGVSVDWMETEGPTAWAMAEKMDDQFDALSGVYRENRKRGDIVSGKIFEKLWKTLNTPEIKEIGNYADKYVAHAADPTSRSSISADEISLTMEKIRICQEKIYVVANAISGILLGLSTHSPLPIPQYSVTEGLDKPWLPSDLLSDLHQAWRENEDRVRSITPLELRV